VREFANAISLWPEDNNVNGNYWFARAELAFRKGDYGSAVEYYKKAIRYYPKEQHLKISLKVAEELLAVSREDWAKAATTVPKGSRLWHYYRGRRAIAERDWDTAVRELEETNFKPEVFWHAVQATEKLLDTPGVSPNIVPSTKAAIASLKKEAKEAEAHKQSAEKF
jgi:tetratricopeptide (TPR) repeat protein